MGSLFLSVSITTYGVIAMHEYVTVPIKFSPDSLADFENRFISALNDERYKVIVLIGGPTYFSMGMDLTYISTHYDADFVSQFCHILKW